jgi:uncharacterized protein (TIGR02118 family)
MAQVIALYNHPKDAAAFDKYYFSTHIPVAKKIPGLRAYHVSDGAVMTPTGPSLYHLVALLDFDSMEAIQKALDSKEGAATAGDLANFAQAGVTLLMCNIKKI